LTTKGNTVGLVQIICDESIADTLEERGCKLWLLGLDEVKQPRHVLGRCDLLDAVRGGEILENREGRTTDVLLAQIFNARLPLLDGIDDQVVESATSCRWGDIVFIWDRPQTSESALEGC
jgi:hypothetical protein